MHQYNTWDDYQDEQDGYSNINPDKFYTSYSSDERGEVITYREDPKFVRQIKKLLAAGQIPAYETMADVIRDAVRHRFFYLNNDWDMPEHMRKMLQLQQIKSEWDDMGDYLAQMASIAQTAEQHMEAAFQERDKPALERMLSTARNTLVRLQDPYYQQLAQVIRQYEIKMESMG